MLRDDGRKAGGAGLSSSGSSSSSCSSSSSSSSSSIAAVAAVVLQQCSNCSSTVVLVDRGLHVCLVCSGHVTTRGRRAANRAAGSRRSTLALLFSLYTIGPPGRSGEQLGLVVGVRKQRAGKKIRIHLKETESLFPAPCSPRLCMTRRSRSIPSVYY